jgi:hypothetical protein
VVDAFTLSMQGKQIDQIAQGLISGELSGNEAGKLLEGQAGIAQSTSKAEEDGKIGWADRLEVGVKQAQAWVDIVSSSLNEERAVYSGTTPPSAS